MERNKLHLGCGPYALDGWINIDVQPFDNVRPHDLTKPLPFANCTCSRIYSEHFIEHLTREQAQKFLNECYRVLELNGVIRISTPNLGVLLQDYCDWNTDRWSPVWEPETPCRMINEGMRNWGHQFIYDDAELKQALSQAGFKLIRRCAHHCSEHDDLTNLEVRPDHLYLIMESIKPRSISSLETVTWEVTWRSKSITQTITKPLCSQDLTATT